MLINDDLWLTQDLIAELFGKDRTIVTKHINNIFEEKELDEKSNVQKNAHLKGVLMKEELSEFLKTAYKYGRVKDLEEAFKEFPVEEEWHKGKIENVINEDSEIYSVYEIGDIVFVKEYTYSDGKIGKVDSEKIEEYKKSFYDTLKENNQ